jgi:hypothetical protein
MSNKDLKYKYLKYKNKYLDLQSQIDRSSILDVENYSTALQIIKQDPFKNLLGQLNKELYTQDKDIKNKYHQKYLKYKNKYLYLQSIIGGGPKLGLPLDSVQRRQRLQANQALRTARTELKERLKKEEEKKLKKKEVEKLKKEEVIKEERFNVEIIENITLDEFNERIINSNLNFYETIPAKYEILNKVFNIDHFYNMMRKTCARSSYNYKPVYFNFQCDGENVGGCAIWIMDLDETRKFAYFYGLHKFPQYFDRRDNFSSHRLLSSVISYCDTKNIEFICLPRPCLIATTKLWYSIGMTFDILNDKGNYLSYLKKEPAQASNLKNHSSTITEDLLKVYEKVNAINMLEKDITNSDFGPFLTTDITNSDFGPFLTTDITKGGLLYKDNYHIAISLSFKKQEDQI